jgi:hypothetical protein
MSVFLFSVADIQPRSVFLTHGGKTMNLLATVAEARGNGLKVLAESCADHGRRDRIAAALGPLGEDSPRVNEENHARYYRYLAARLSFPFTAHYPEPRSSLEEAEYRCAVLELLDPGKDIYDELDGIFCKTRKGKYEVNLPLIELEIPEDSPDSQLIEDYRYWFWNWR